MADGVLSRLDSILESSAEIFPAGMMASVPSADKFSMPGGDGFYYSFLFEDFVGFVKLDWFKVDSGMRPFEVKVTKENSDFLREEFVSPLLRSFDSEIERQFLAKKSSFSSLRSVSKGEFEKIVGEDWMSCRFPPTTRRDSAWCFQKSLFFPCSAPGSTRRPTRSRKAR